MVTLLGISLKASPCQIIVWSEDIPFYNVRKKELFVFTIVAVVIMKNAAPQIVLLHNKWKKELLASRSTVLSQIISNITYQMKVKVVVLV